MALMGPRKRVKPSPTPSNDELAPDALRNAVNPPKRGSTRWYPGSWPAISRGSKAAPVTEVVRESISVAKNVASNITASSSVSLFEPHKPNRNPTLQLTRKEASAIRSLPANATTTCINIASDGSASTPTVPSAVEPSPSPQPAKPGNSSETGLKDIPAEVSEGNTEDPVAANKECAEGNADTSGEGTELGNNPAPTNSETAGWFSWFYSRPPAQEKVPSCEPDPVPSTAEVATEPMPQEETGVEQNNPQPVARQEEQEQQQERQEQEQQHQQQQQENDTLEGSSRSQKRSWFQMWNGSSEMLKQKDDQIEPPPEPLDPPAEPADNVMSDVATLEPHLPESNRYSGWSFWAREPAKNEKPGASSEVQPAEVSATQSPPTNPLTPDPDVELRAEVTKKGSVRAKKPGNEIETAAITHDPPVPAVEGFTTTPSPLAKKVEPTASKQLQKVLPNQVLPHFRDTFALKDQPSILQTIGRFLHYSKEPENKHVYMVKDPPQIRKALAIGVHGYFPAPLIRSVLGQPTGTSIRFSNMAANSIRKWTENRGYKCDIEKIALEGEGRIAERVDLLWKLLLNWMEEIRKADFILLACHSQGVPVAIMLVAKLISFGCLNATRVGICAMAGVNLGPFPDYKSRWISGSAGELFEFALPYSQVSKDYEIALKSVLGFGVRISYIGSIDDQLVSLESSLFSAVSHPYIYRAVFVDGRVHAPSFLSHLVGFILKLRNLGISDHGLIKELSTPLAGSLYSGEGHSRLYDDENVYLLAVEFALETSTLSSTSLEIKRANPSPTPNPYILPFAMRGILEEEYVRRELQQETMELLRQFDDWRPSTKVLRDVKFRLEGIRSKL
ncbi:hypothetical protein ASPZODRAFT_138076 [Penicilliopsis zonata CBS 506.65]|uniref:YMC020W-like alpha/beta hydrolase domain-containing protein n=1 Tax=Penicilliopsis zonata CBS 506.65 TaxID=1073090 RepID=A0A1L9SUQ5_9EURO|nr:hypothetical protein ASPZODRAFT_138076 [Penicilliopsis zonata CBS 506.65]OJJ50950.1 hypothetical protein ASPZODRAFT_138076 [Penicilliopsis zonata CBS 506.65]